jgi:hypothetical protein
MTSFESTFNASLNNFALRSSFPPPTSTAKVAGTPLITSNVITSNNTDTLQLSPLIAQETLQQARFANFSPEQVHQRVAESLVTFLDSPVSQVLSEELPEGLKNNASFALLMSEKAVDYLDSF